MLVMNTAYGVPEMLPFDLRHLRVLTYTLGTEPTDRTAVSLKLTSDIDATLRAVLVGGVARGRETMELLLQQLDRMGKLGQENNIAGHYRKPEVYDIHYDGRLLDTSLDVLATTLAAHPAVLIILQNLQQSIRRANGHAARWPNARQGADRIFKEACGDAISIQNEAARALSDLKRILGRS